MKRAGALYNRISSYENLCIAYHKAVRGKQNRREVIRFRTDFDVNIQKLRNQLIEKRLHVGDYRFFTVHDPKPRDICAASFRERVLHHAIMNICGPVLESYAIFDSYACRKGKGVPKAMARTQTFARRYEWYLKLDIRKYFDSIDQGIILALLKRRLKDRDLLALFEKLIDTYHTERGKGLPIGNLISQHLANFYLGYFDHWIKEVRRIKGYLRYMDDFILFGDRKSNLKSEYSQIMGFLEDELRLKLKGNFQLNKCRYGIPFLGYRVFPEKTLLSPRSRNRFAHKFKKYEEKHQEGKWTTRELVSHVGPLIAFTRHADAHNFRRKIIQNTRVSF